MGMDSLLSELERWLGIGVSPEDFTVWQVMARAVVIFVASLVMLRVGHKRFFARRNAIDVLIMLVLASTMARAINGSGALAPSIAGGFLLVFLHRGCAWLSSRVEWIERLLKGRPVCLIENGRVDEDALRRHALGRGDLAEDLRINGLSDPAEVERAMLERNGEISVRKRARS